MKRLLCVFLTLFLFVLPLGASAQGNAPYVCDRAEILSETEVSELETLAENVSKKHGIDVAVLTVKSLDGEDEVLYADDYYDSYFGKDGVLLLYAVEDEIRYVSTCGKCMDAIDDNLAEISEAINDPFYSEDYAKGFSCYINTVDNLMSSRKIKDLSVSILISLAVGFVTAFIVTAVLKSQLDGAKFNNRAEEYVKRGSLNITSSRDLFLYRTVSRVPKPQNNSSSAHKSGSGRTHGGGRV